MAYRTKSRWSKKHDCISTLSARFTQSRNCWCRICRKECQTRSAKRNTTSGYQHVERQKSPIFKGRYCRRPGSCGRTRIFQCRFANWSTAYCTFAECRYSMYSLCTCQLCGWRKGYWSFYRRFIEWRRIFGTCFRCFTSLRKNFISPSGYENYGE